MTICKFKNYVIHNLSESGRSMVEVMAVLAIVGILSVAGFWMYRTSNQERQMNDIIYHMNLQVAQIYPAIEKEGSFASKEHFNRFLAPYTKDIGNYVLTFRADPNASGNDFVVQITQSNGEPIKGKMCRALISKMSKLKMAQDVSFSLKDEEMDDGSIQDVMVPLNGQIMDYAAVCGN